MSHLWVKEHGLPQTNTSQQDITVHKLCSSFKIPQEGGPWSDDCAGTTYPVDKVPVEEASGAMDFVQRAYL